MFKYAGFQMESDVRALFASLSETREKAQQIGLRIVLHTLNHRNDALVRRFVELLDSDEASGIRRDSMFLWLQKHACCNFTVEGVGANKKTIVTFDKERAPKAHDVEENEKRMEKARAEKWWTIKQDKDKSSNYFDLYESMQKLATRASKQLKKASEEPLLLVPDATGKPKVAADAATITVLNALASGKGELIARMYRDYVQGTSPNGVIEGELVLLEKAS